MVSRMTNRLFVQMGHVEIRQSYVSCLPFSESMFNLVTAVNTHNYWPDLVTDMHEIFRVLKPGGQFFINWSVYEGGKYDKRNQKYAPMIKVAFPSVDELREFFLVAGHSEVQMDENHNWSWMCGIGRKPSRN
jgi:SAM-dependent methyltransferase